MFSGFPTAFNVKLRFRNTVRKFSGFTHDLSWRLHTCVSLQEHHPRLAIALELKCNSSTQKVSRKWCDIGYKKSSPAQPLWWTKESGGIYFHRMEQYQLDPQRNKNHWDMNMICQRFKNLFIKISCLSPSGLYGLFKWNIRASHYCSWHTFICAKYPYPVFINVRSICSHLKDGYHLLRYLLNIKSEIFHLNYH